MARFILIWMSFVVGMFVLDLGGGVGGIQLVGNVDLCGRVEQEEW